MLRALLGVDLGDADLIRKIANLGFAVAGDDHDMREVVLRAEVLYKGEALCARRIAKAQRGGVAAVHDDDAFEPPGDLGKLIGTGKILRDEFAAAGDLHGVTGHGAAQPLPRLLPHLSSFGQGEVLLLCCGDDGARERVLGVALQTGDEGEHGFGLQTGGGGLLSQRGLAISEGAGFVKDGGAAAGDLLQYDRAFDNDGAARAE